MPLNIQSSIVCTPVYLSIITDHTHPFMAKIYTVYIGYIQHENAPCHQAQVISIWFHEHDNKSPELNPIKHLWDPVEWEILGM